MTVDRSLRLVAERRGTVLRLWQQDGGAIILNFILVLVTFACHPNQVFYSVIIAISARA
jgi:hypothetical protein